MKRKKQIDFDLPLEIEANHWYIDDVNDIFFLLKIDEDLNEYDGQFMDRTNGIWLRCEIIRRASDFEIESMKFTYKSPFMPTLAAEKNPYLLQ